MKKIILLWSVVFFLPLFAVAQDQTEKDDAADGKPKVEVFDSAIKQEMMKQRLPMPYPRSREADVVWSKQIWRVISLTEKMNYPLYFPTEDMKNRTSFVQTLVNGIREGEITAYSTFPTDINPDFETILSIDDVNTRLGAEDKTVTRERLDGEGDTTILIEGNVTWSEVRELLVKEEWFFDKHYSRMFVRIIAVCPIRWENRNTSLSEDEELEEDPSQVSKRMLFWVYYPEARFVLANTPCYMGENESAQISYDDLMINRIFASYIVAESNTMNNRQISSYSRDGLEAMMESERVKRQVFNFEHDLWEY